jgi:hypothetical protein
VQLNKPKAEKHGPLPKYFHCANVQNCGQVEVIAKQATGNPYLKGKIHQLTGGRDTGKG